MSKYDCLKDFKINRAYLSAKDVNLLIIIAEKFKDHLKCAILDYCFILKADKEYSSK